MQPSHARRRLNEALGLVALELADLVRLADQLEMAIASLARRVCASDPQSIADCQVADLLAQRLAGVSGFLGGLADSTPQDVCVDLTRAMTLLTLGEQARRFAGPSAQADVASEVGATLFFADEA
jgi:hypothetical protein